jgi:hypothetical protein
VGLPALARAVVEDFLDEFDVLLGDALTSLYVTGSAAYGGFESRASDVDGIAVLSADWQERCSIPDAERMVRVIQERHGGTPCQIQFRTFEQVRDTLPLVDLAAWHATGVLICGADVRDEVPVPTLEDLRLDMVLLFVGRYGGPLGSTLPFSWEPAADLGTYLRHPTMLPLWISYPARFLHTWATGAVVGKQAAVEWYAVQWPGGAADWMHSALQWRGQGCPGDEREISNWAARIPAHTHRLAARMHALLRGPDGTPASLDDLCPEASMDETMRSLAAAAADALDAYPRLERRRGNLQWCEGHAGDNVRGGL